MFHFVRFINQFVIRDMMINRMRTILTVLGIALGVAVMLAINLANATALFRFQESIDVIAGRSNLQIVPAVGKQFDQNVLKGLQFLWQNDAYFTPVIDELAVIVGSKPEVVQVLGVDMFADPHFRPFDIAGGKKSWSKDIFNRNAVYVGARLAKNHHLIRGGNVRLLVNDKERIFNVVDILDDSGTGKAFGGNLIVMDIGPAQESFAMPGAISRVDLLVPERQVRQFSSKLRAKLPAYLVVQRPQQRGGQVQKMIAAFQANLAALSLIALLVGMFLIYNTMSITIIRKRVEIGILRTLGVSAAQIVAIFLTQALALGVTGSAIGAGVGLLFAGGAVKAVSNTVQALYVDQPMSEVTVDYGVLFFAFAMGVLLTLIAAAGPIWEAMSVAPAQASRRASYESRIGHAAPRLALIGLFLLVLSAFAATFPPLNGFPAGGYAAATLIIFGMALALPLTLSIFINVMRAPMFQMFAVEGRLALLSLGGTLGRTSVTVASLMIGIAMMVSLAIMIGSFRQTVIAWVNQTLKADLYVEPLSRATSNRAGRLTARTVSAIRRLPGVSAVDAFVDIPIEYKGNPTNLGAGDVSVLLSHGQLLFVDGESSRSVLNRVLHGDHSGIVSESFALKNNVAKGDDIMLPGTDRSFWVHVEGVYYDYASDLGYIVLPRELYGRHFPDTYSTTLGIYALPGANIDSIRADMSAQLGVDTRLNIRTNRELRTEVLRVFDNTFSITYALHIIAIVVAILAVMNALFSLSFELRREFAILSYLGSSKEQLQRVIILQAGLLGFLGNVAGILVGIVLSLLLINVINKQSFGWTVQFMMPWPYLVQSFLLIMAFSVASGFLPAKLAMRTLSPETVRWE